MTKLTHSILRTVAGLLMPRLAHRDCRWVVAITIVVLFLAAMSTRAYAIQETDNPGRADFVATGASAVARHPNGMFLQANYDLGELPAGKKGVLKLQLLNPDRTPIRFSGVRSQCSCTHLRTSSFEIAPEGAIWIEAELSTPDRALSGDAMLVFYLNRPDGETAVVVQCRYRLAGLLSAKSQSLMVQLGPDDALGFGRVPLVITSPVEPHEITIATSGNLNDIVVGLQAENDETFLVATASRLAVQNGPACGTVTLRHEPTGRLVQVLVSVKARESLVARPAVCWLRPSTGNPGEMLEATMLLEIDPQALRPAVSRNAENLSAGESATSERPDIQFGAECAALPEIRFEVTRLGERFARIKASLPRSRASDVPSGHQPYPETGQILWKAVVADKTILATSEFRVFSN